MYYTVADVAQMVEHLFCKQKVVGSIPTIGSDFFHGIDYSLTYWFVKIDAFFKKCFDGENGRHKGLKRLFFMS